MNTCTGNNCNVNQYLRALLLCAAHGPPNVASRLLAYTNTADTVAAAVAAAATFVATVVAVITAVTVRWRCCGLSNVCVTIGAGVCHRRWFSITRTHFVTQIKAVLSVVI
jgi:hypothetical protein